MDSTLIPLPEAFLRHRTSPGHYAPPGEGGPKENRTSAGTASPDGSQWSLKSMWPAWKQQEPAGNGESRGPATEGTVGPFGNGAGAAGSGRNLASNSRLFGGSTAGVGGRSAEVSKDSSFDTWRVQARAGQATGGASHLPGRPLRDSGDGVGGSKGSSHWVPDFSRGSAGLPSSAAAAGGRYSEELEASADLSAGSRSRSSLAAAPVFSPRNQTATGTREVSPGGYRSGGGSGGKAFSDAAFSSFGASARFHPGGAHQPAAAGPFGTANTLDAENIGGGFEEDNEEDDENPFA